MPGPLIGIRQGCAGDIQDALRSPPASVEPAPGHRPAPDANGHQAAFPVARSASGIPGFTGDACAICNSFTMIRDGTCQTCLSCGQTSGCSCWNFCRRPAAWLSRRKQPQNRPAIR